MQSSRFSVDFEYLGVTGPSPVWAPSGSESRTRTDRPRKFVRRAFHIKRADSTLQRFFFQDVMFLSFNLFSPPQDEGFMGQRHGFEPKKAFSMTCATGESKQTPKAVQAFDFFENSFEAITESSKLPPECTPQSNWFRSSFPE